MFRLNFGRTYDFNFYYMKSHYIQTRVGGYVALMATIIITAILLVMSVEGSIAGWHARFNVLGTEAKEQASALAQGCADQALSAMITDPSYTGDATTTTDIGTCHVFPIGFNTPATGIVTIRTQANVRGSFANLEMQMNMSEIHIDSVPSAPSQGTIVIITNVLNDGSGSLNATDFTMSVNGTNVSQASFNGDEGGVPVTVDQGTYTVTGEDDSDYARTTSTNCSGTINQGEIKFCTITYDDITTTLTILVNVTNDNGGTLTYSDFPVFIDGTPATPGQQYDVSDGNHTVSATAVTGYSASPWGFQCASGGTITVNEGESKTCIINVNDNLPPAPSCADTVMILDRTGSMSNTDLSNERTAGNALTDLYASVLLPALPPHLSVGSIGGLNGSSASIPLLGQLSTIYTNIKSAITSITGSNSSVGSNLFAGITTASDELNGPRHIAGNEKVIILVSDGDPNQPSGSVNTDTGWKAGTASSQESGTSLFTNPEGAYTDGNGEAVGAVLNSINRERYSSFGFGAGLGLPAGATVRGIETRVSAWVTAPSVNTPGSSQRSPSSIVAPNQWTNASQAYSSNDSYATNAVNGQGQGYGNFGFAIPSNATITGVQVTTEAKTSGTSVTTPTLFPTAQGTYTAWTNGESAIDETGTPDCSGSDSVLENNTNDRESVAIDVSSIPNGAIITDVTISTYDRGDFFSGGTYRTFVRVNGSDTDAGGTSLTATGNSVCNLKTQSINIPDTTKSGSTNIEIGVVKTSGNSSTVRVGAIRATVTYTLANPGSLSIAISSNNGVAWTTTKPIAVTSIEAVTAPTGNSPTDLWNRSWTPSDFNNGNFALRVVNTSATGVSVSLDAVNVTVSYTVPTSAGASCQLGVDLSWNGGASWTSEKTTPTLTGTESTTTLGTPTDDWSSSHTWLPAEFTNTNFRTRVRAIDPGAACDSTANINLDFLELKIYYSQNTDPVQAALSAADTAKLAGINVYTIHFGADAPGYNGRELLANLANGTGAVSGHEPGSIADPGSVTSGDTGLKIPGATTAPNQWSNPSRAFLSDNSYTTTAVNGNQQGYSTFGLVVPPTAIVNGIAVEVEAKSTDSSGCQLGAELSWDNGVTFTSTNLVSSIFGNDSNYTLGGSTNTWGRAWTSDNFADGKFVVRLKNIDPGNACTNNSTLSIDRVRARVYYTVNLENGDGDNFFISPTSADMKGIFEFIGEEVCPAIGYAAATQPPTTGNVTTVVRVINNNGGSQNPSDITVDVTPGSASPNSFTGSLTGVVVTLNPGSYSISGTIPDGYAEIIGAGCSSDGTGNLEAGEYRMCVLTYDDIPPPPPAPNLSIHIGSWRELPVAN